jgi:hypothetical protein
VRAIAAIQVKRLTLAVLVLVAPLSAVAAPTIIWARTLDRESTPPVADNPPVVAPVETVSPGRKCTDRLTAADVTRNDLIAFKVRPEDVIYPECDGLADDDIAELCGEMLKLGQSAPEIDKQVGRSDDPLADWLAKYAGHIVAILTLIVTAVVGFYSVAHTRHQMRAPKLSLTEAAPPAVEQPETAAASSRPRRRSAGTRPRRSPSSAR